MLRRSRQMACWSMASFETVSLMRTSCSAGVNPSGLRSAMPSRTWALMPATRTMKNSSRLLAEIDRNRTRSSAGWPGLTDSSSTRRLKCSHESSRLMKRSGLLLIAGAVRESDSFSLITMTCAVSIKFQSIPKQAAARFLKQETQTMCYRDDVSMTLTFPASAPSRCETSPRDQAWRSNSAASARVTGRPSRKASVSRNSTACRTAA